MARPRSTMTSKWSTVLAFIKAYRNVYNKSPSYSTIAKGVGLKSRSNICRIVKRLEMEGLLESHSGRVNRYKVVDKSVEEMVSL